MPLAHGFTGPAGGVSSGLYLVAAIAAFVFLEARDRRRTATDPSSLNRRVRVSATLCIVALIAGATALWWVPGARTHDQKKSASTAASPLIHRGWGSEGDVAVVAADLRRVGDRGDDPGARRRGLDHLVDQA